MIPIPVSKIPLLKNLNAPIDFGLTWNDKPLMGPNKTWRGLLVGTIAAVITFQFQVYLATNTSILSDTVVFGIDYANPTASNYVLMALLGFGALFGDAVESIAKRQLGIQSGKSWKFFDQTDYVFGALLLGQLANPLPINTLILSIVVWGLIHPLATVFGYLIGMKDSPI